MEPSPPPRDKHGIAQRGWYWDARHYLGLDLVAFPFRHAPPRVQSSAHKDMVIFHWTSSNPADAANRTNAAYLAAAYSLIILGRSPEQAYAPLQKIGKTLATFRDASYSNTCEYRLPIISCMAGWSPPPFFSGRTLVLGGLGCVRHPGASARGRLIDLA